MRFTTSCYIRKNTPELRKKLEDLGYRIKIDQSVKRATSLTDDSVSMAYIGNYAYLKSSGRIDCGTNEQLFLAIAALRDDSDYMQWFTDGKEWIFCDREDWVDMYSVLCCGKGHDYQYVLDKYHKATVETLIEHFKNKEQ